MAAMERLGHLKFMQTARLREEEKKKRARVDEDATPDESQWTISKKPGKKCVVIVEGDPLPGASSGRMSFQGPTPTAGETAPTPDPSEVIQDPENSQKRRSKS